MPSKLATKKVTGKCTEVQL